MGCSFSNDSRGLLEGRGLALPCSCRWEIKIARLASVLVSRMGGNGHGVQMDTSSGEVVMEGRLTMMDKAKGRVIGRQMRVW